ncbi:SAM domain-containing protein [Caenorhabditis elegans]|uniref:SAM domain-containing protein n=1 Tax=Caenorhabditis elegans TaxID=6239 RepID=P91122_CAEEL|nr:SAM domain-containing protein [Caenorhabditis elegans]CCD61579.1 SAM domain-containing protein [Caenorhabditis elegans]|eukprot:NP_491547.1 Uncharacterized protein CELE_C32E12.1 [Caenorhabditis elegans]
MTVHKKTEKKTKTESPVKPKKVASKHVKNKKDKKDKKDRKVKKVEQKDKKDKKEKNVKKGSKSDPNAVAKIKKNKKDKKSKDKKPKDKKSKEKKPKAAKSKEVKSKDVKPKDVKSKDEKKKKKNSKGKKPSTDPLFSGPLTQAPKRSKGETQELNQLLENNAQNKPKKVKEPSGIDAIDLKSDSLVVEKTQLSGDSALRVTAKEKKKTKKTEIVVKEVKEEKKKDTGSVSEDENDIKAFQAEKSKEIETKKNEEMEKKQEEPKVKPVPPGTTPDTTTTTPEKKSKSITDSNIKPELDEIPEARTPEAEGPPMMVKERSEKRLKIESTQDTDDSDPKKVKSGPKKIRPESFKLKKTQSFSPVNIVSTVPDQVKKPGKNSPKDEHVMKTPPIENPVAAKKNPFDPLRSELETPIQEPAFVVNRGDTKIKNMEIKLVNLDLVGRTGMYMERCGMNAERKEAFDWLAYNRHDLNNKQKEFSQNLSVALSDIGITKELLMRTIIYLKSHNQITPSEMDMVLKDVKGCKGDTVSFSQLSVFLQSHCAVYKKHTNSKDH